MIKASGVHPVTRCEKAVRPGRNPSHSGMPAGSGTGESCSGSPAVMARMPVLRRLTGPFSRPTCSSRVIKLEGRGDHFPSAISPRTLIKSCIVSILTFRSRIAFFRSIDRDSNLGWSRLSPRIGALRTINCLCGCQKAPVILFLGVRPRRSGHRTFCFLCGGNALVILIPFLIHSHHREYCFPQCGGICGTFLTLMPERHTLMGILRNRGRSIG